MLKWLTTCGMLTVDSDIKVDVAACQLRSSNRSIERATHDIAELAVEANRLAKDMVDGRVIESENGSTTKELV